MADHIIVDSITFSATPTPSSSPQVLPNELLIEIFKKGTEAWALSKSAQSTLPFPIPVSGVCSRWRALALDTPELWRIIHPPLNHEIANTLDPYTWVSTWIRRSKAMPITVVLDIPATSPHIKEICFSRIIRLIVTGVPTRRLDIRCQQERGEHFRAELLLPFQEFVGKQHCRSFKQLSLCFPGALFDERVTLTDSNDPWRLEVDEMPIFCVSKLRLQGIRINPLQFPNLTSLTIFNLAATYKSLRSFLATSPSLTNLSLRDFSILPRANGGHLDIGNIYLPSLQTLVIKFATTYWNEAYPLSYLHLPNLRYLELDGNLKFSLAQVLGEPPSAHQLETLILSNFEESSCWPPAMCSYSLHSVKYMRLINVRFSEVIAPLPIPATVPASLLNWPCLQTLAMNAILARDIVDLLNLTGPHIRTVYLTSAAQHHLSHNMRRNEGSGTFYLGFPLVSRGDTRHVDMGEKDPAEIVAAWYKKRVAVKDFDPTLHSCLLEDPEERGSLVEML